LYLRFVPSVCTFGLYLRFVPSVSKISLHVGGRIMAGSTPPLLNTFMCPHCRALYQIVKVEAGPETDSREIVCRACGGPLTGREGKLVLKYFLLRKADRPRRRA